AWPYPTSSRIAAGTKPAQLSGRWPELTWWPSSSTRSPFPLAGTWPTPTNLQPPSYCSDGRPKLLRAAQLFPASLRKEKHTQRKRERESASKYCGNQKA
ncbi:hypothetical protein LEMLEM_LOCUS373, partial [Lemmus lemmus]